EATAIHEEPVAGQGAAAGVVGGGVVGGVLPATAGLIPGIGPVLTAGIWATMLVGAGGGAAAGGLLRARRGLGGPAEQNPCYRQAFDACHVLVTVRGSPRNAEARAILERCGAYTDPQMTQLMRAQG